MFNAISAAVVIVRSRISELVMLIFGLGSDCRLDFFLPFTCHIISKTDFVFTLFLKLFPIISPLSFFGFFFIYFLFS